MADGERVRLPAWAWQLERHFGAKVARCRNCGSFDLVRLYHRDSYRCDGCGYELHPEFGIDWVPADPNVRLPGEGSDV